MLAETQLVRRSKKHHDVASKTEQKDPKIIRSRAPLAINKQRSLL
jgi:hypothetical protein